MESLPLIAKSNAIPNLDVTSLIREIFQTEFGSYVPSKKLSENLRKSLVHEKFGNEESERETYRSLSFLENLPNEKGKLAEYADNVFEAYVKHQKALDEITNVELNLMEAQAMYLKREKLIQSDYYLSELLRLKRYPLMKSYNADYVKEYKLLQGESGLPPKHEANLDFRIKDFKKWKKKLSNPSNDSLLMMNVNKTNFIKLKPITMTKQPIRKERIIRPKKAKIEEKKENLEIFRADMSTVCFTGYTVGDVYQCRVTVMNVYTKPMKFILKPLPIYSPYKVQVYGTESTRILPGFTFKLLITFTPRNLDIEDELIILIIEDGTELVIPLTSYLEPPLLKTHEDLDEHTKKMSEKIRSSYIDCGQCFPGDSNVIKIRFYSFGGTGEFFLMSQDNWNDWNIENLTSDNFTEIPPFRLYPSYFQIEKDQVIDLFVDFKPQTSGLHCKNIVIACNNGEVRSLDILGDGIAYNDTFFTFEESLEKNFSPSIHDDLRATYYLDFGCLFSTGRKEKVFSVTNKSSMSFEFRWEMRDAIIPFGGQTEPGKLSPLEVRVEPSSGVFDPYTTRTFHASIFIEKKPIGQYRTILSLYVVGLPYESIEQANTIIRPSVLRGRFKSGSIFGEEDNLPVSPEYSYQDTFESVQEGMKTSVELRCQQQFPMAICRKDPIICSIPLRRSKTLSQTGCICNAAIVSVSPESTKECDSSHMNRKPNISDLGSDLLWDFVDVLVDEVEVWLEVDSPNITVEPCIVNVYDDIRINQEPVQYKVRVRNFNDLPITCKWMKNINKVKMFLDEEDEELNTLYHPKSQQDEESEIKEEEWEEVSDSSVCKAEYCLQCYVSQKCPIGTEIIEDASANRYCDLNILPKGPFTVSSQSEIECILYVSAHQPGIINRELYLFVEDTDLEITLHIIGKVPDHQLDVSPCVLDFGCQRSGTLFTKLFKIKSLDGERVGWKAEQFTLDYETGVLTGPIHEEMQSSLTRMRGDMEEEGYTIENYTLDARKPGLQTSLIKLDLACPSYTKTHSVYLLVLGEVQTPKLTIEAPRFSNAILSPNRTMYVGQVITQLIVLNNVTKVMTTFIWGKPFGCHARKLKIMMSKKCGKIGSLKKLVVEITITPLEEGIIEHFYIPCFFSRKVSPVILSVVGVVKNVQVTFRMEKIDQNCGEMNVDGLSISWPIKNFDPVIGLSYISENDILNFECHCDMVDEEYERSVKEKIKEEEEEKPKEESEEKPCVMKYYTQQRRMELRRLNLQKKELLPETEDLLEEEGEYEEEEEEEEKKSESVSTVAEYQKRECINILYYAASELQFLNVRYKTVSVKHFVIKNDSPLLTNFNLKVKYFGKVEQFGCKNKIHEIKKYVFGREKDQFENSLIYGQPLLITTSPSEGLLEGYASVRVSVFVYGNTWGEYRDFIICNISGMPPFHMKVFVQLSGHPIIFPMFKPSCVDSPVLRFNPIKYGSEPMVRTIRVRNTSSIPITVTWMIFLTLPLPEDFKEEPFSLCLDMYTDRESENQEKTTKSSQNYLSKNTSGSIPFLDTTDIEKTSSQYTGMELEQTSEVDSEKETDFSDVTKTVNDVTKPEIQLLENFGKIDLSVFQVNPRELDLEPYSEEKIMLTFDPSEQGQTQEFEAVMTGCVRLRQEYAHYPEIYHRPCGKDYVSKMLVMTASVEKPFLQFEFFTSDLRYILNANDILKLKNQQWRMKKKFIGKNKNETSINAFVRCQPGEFFTVKRIESNTKIYTKFNPDYHSVTVEPAGSIEIQVEALVAYNQILQMWKKLKYSMQMESEEEIDPKESILVGKGCVISEDSEEDEKTNYVESQADSYRSQLNSSEKIRQHSFTTQESEEKLRNELIEGKTVYKFEMDKYNGESHEHFLPFLENPKKHQWCHVLKENLIFDQIGLMKQVITLELRVFFPFLKLNPKIINFGNVHIGESVRRYSSVINLTQYPTEFAVVSTEESDFVVTPKIAHLPATSNKSDIGQELMVMFTPKKPGYFKTTFKVFANREMVFGYSSLTVLGLGTWDEMYKYPKVDVSTAVILHSGH